MVILLFQSSFVYAEEGVMCMFDGDCASYRSVYFSEHVECLVQTTGFANLRTVKAVSKWVRPWLKVSKSRRKENVCIVINFGIANIEDRVVCLCQSECLAGDYTPWADRMQTVVARIPYRLLGLALL